MRYFFRRRIPVFARVLVVESGSRRITERLILHLEERFGEEMELDLVTCFDEDPAGFRGRVYRVTDYSGAAERAKLIRELRARRHTVAGIICSAEPIMTKWKWALAARLPAKIFVVNENADYFWLDYAHSRKIVQFARIRSGVRGASAMPAIGRVLSFPFALVYLLLFAGAVHLRRKLRTL